MILIKGYSTYFTDKTTDEEISNERLLIIMINTLGKICVKFKCYVSKTIQCFKDVSLILTFLLYILFFINFLGVRRFNK
jgi:hypothetical protein